MTPGGTVTLKSTLQCELAHARLGQGQAAAGYRLHHGGRRVSRWSYMIVSVTWTRLTGPDATCTWPP